jgi:Tfp pilus assembly protein PilF
MTDMDRRKLVWLSGLIVGGLVGCAQTAANKPAPAANQAAVASSNNSSNQTASNQSPDSQKIDAKPSSLAQIADLQAEIANDKSRSNDDRQNALNLAKTNYQRAIKLDANYLPAYLGMARLCSSTGEHEAAVNMLDSALAKFPREAQLWYERGMIMGREKKYDEALGNLNQAVKLDPNNATYGKNVGLMLARAGRADDGVAALQHWMSEPDAHYNVARILEHMGQTAESRRQLQLALQADPNHHASLAMYKEVAN